MLFVTDQLRDTVDQRLRAIETRAAWLENASNWPNELWVDETRLWAAERALHVAIECVTDAANLVIDALVMREPGTYADIVRVVAEEGVVDTAWFEAFLGALSLRNRLVHEYAVLSSATVTAAVHDYAVLFRPFVTSVRTYLGISSK